MIMAGGTGGHVFPGLAVAELMRARGWQVVWLGSRGGMEATLVPARGYPMAWIDFAGLRGKGALSWALLPLRLLRAFAQSIGVLRAHRPDAVLGMGGYVSFPGGMMAALIASLDRSALAAMASKARGLAKTDAAERVAAACMELAR